MTLIDDRVKTSLLRRTMRDWPWMPAPGTWLAEGFDGSLAPLALRPGEQVRAWESPTLVVLETRPTPSSCAWLYIVELGPEGRPHRIRAMNAGAMNDWDIDERSMALIAGSGCIAEGEFTYGPWGCELRRFDLRRGQQVGTRAAPMPVTGVRVVGAVVEAELSVTDLHGDRPPTKERVTFSNDVEFRSLGSSTCGSGPSRAWLPVVAGPPGHACIDINGRSFSMPAIGADDEHGRRAAKERRVMRTSRWLTRRDAALWLATESAAARLLEAATPDWLAVDEASDLLAYACGGAEVACCRLSDGGFRWWRDLRRDIPRLDGTIDGVWTSDGLVIATRFGVVGLSRDGTRSAVMRGGLPWVHELDLVDGFVVLRGVVGEVAVAHPEVFVDAADASVPVDDLRDELEHHLRLLVGPRVVLTTALEDLLRRRLARIADCIARLERAALDGGTAQWLAEARARAARAVR